MTKLICDKHDIILKKDKDNTFTLELDIKNDNIIIPNMLHIKLYHVLAEINKKYIEKMELVKEEKDRGEFLILLDKLEKTWVLHQSICILK